ncbi:MAG: hypothetical protein LBT82_01730 [Oscillospiraceae bacterium]|jgi:hypothetical protein|nr:hypothetical protein [Oscillospiraceae bacterium]
MKIKHSWFLFIFSFLFLIPLGVFTGISSAKGTLIVFGKIDALTLALYMIATSFIAISIISALSSDSKFDNNQVKANFLLTIAYFIAGAAMFCCGLWNFSSIKDFDLFFVFLSIFGILGGLVFIVFGVTSILGKNLYDIFPYSSIFPLSWSFLHLYDYHLAAGKQQFEELEIFNVLYFGLLVIFFLYQSRISTNVFFKGQKIKGKVTVFGMSGALCCLFFACLEISKQLSSNSIRAGVFFSKLVDLSVALYAIVFVWSITATEKKNSLK